MKRLRAMIVDDERVIVDGFLKLVNWDDLGCDVAAVAYDGIMAANEILRLRPDLVVMDINMPLRSGLEVIRQVGAECQNTVFIIISGYDEFGYMREALKLRVYDYLLKPVDFAAFEELLRKLRREKFDLPGAPAPEAEVEGEGGVPTVNRIVAYINEHFAEDLSLKTLARQFYMNPAYLSQYFKNKTGMNYYAYLSHLRVERAKQLLLTTEMSISEIAAKVGCADYRTFTKRFHKAEGQTPSEYRKNRGEKG